MKSAYERALERFGSEEIKKLSDEQKEAIAEVDSKYKAKIAQTELHYRERLATADRAEADKLREEMAVELASHRGACEREKDKIRNAE